MESPLHEAIRFAEEYGYNRWMNAQDEANRLLKVELAARDLDDALERLHENFKTLLAGRPVRDVPETYGEVNYAREKFHAALNPDGG